MARCRAFGEIDSSEVAGLEASVGVGIVLTRRCERGEGDFPCKSYVGPWGQEKEIAWNKLLDEAHRAARRRNGGGVVQKAECKCLGVVGNSRTDHTRESPRLMFLCRNQ